MFCKHCGKENASGSSFCGSCGHSLKEIPSNKNQKSSFLIDKFKELPKKSKIIMLTVIVVVLIALIVLIVLLNNPVKKVEDNLSNYYYFYNDNRNKELNEIGKILKNNKDNSKVLNSIKETTHKITSVWVKNFNTKYSSLDNLETTYKKLSSSLDNLYNYYNGLEYILDYDLYVSYKEELEELYNSKKSFFKGEENKKNNDAYYAYYYYGKVSEQDFYYSLAKKYVDEYIQNEITAFKETVDNMLNNPNNEEKLENYYETFEYLKENKISNNIDLSESEYYQELYNEIIKKITEETKLTIDSLEDDNKCLEVINKSLEIIDDEELSEYKELLTLKTNYEEKQPISLLERHLVSSTTGSSHSKYTRIINNTEYNSYLSFKNTNIKESRVYNLNKEYQTFKTNIIKDEEMDNIKGVITIYGDDLEIYQKDISSLENIEINVSDVNILKIEFTPDTSTELTDFNIYLVEPYLYK